MNHPSLIKYIGAIAVVLFVIGVPLIYFIRQNENRFASTNIKEGTVTLMKTLKAKDGTVLGDIKVIGLHSSPTDPSVERNLDNVFTSLNVVKEIDGKEVVLYAVNSDGFFNTLGKDQEVSKDKFYGYQFTAIFDDHFVVHLLGDNGKNISDDVTVAWNPKKNIFEIQRPHVEGLDETPPAFIGSLNAPDGSALGGVYVTYSDADKSVINLLYIIRVSAVGTKSVYVISEKGFSSSPNKYDIEIGQGNFHGLKLERIKEDYFTVHLLNDKGEESPNVITVKWNYQKKIFEAQK